MHGQAKNIEQGVFKGALELQRGDTLAHTHRTETETEIETETHKVSEKGSKGDSEEHVHKDSEEHV